MADDRVVNFTVHKNTREKRQRREVWSHLQAWSKAASKDIDGYALVTYSRGPNGARYESHSFCRDLHDIASLPSVVSEEIRRGIDRNAKSKD